MMVQERALEQAREYEVIGPDTRRCEQDTKRFPFRFICSLHRHSRGPWGSGTLIGPRTVLTAGHCLTLTRPGDLLVIPGRRGADRSSRPFGDAQAAAFHLAPGYVLGEATDYGVVVLSQPIGNLVGWWTFDAFRWTGDPDGTSILQRGLPLPAPQLPVNISGYPCDRPKDRSDRCFRSGQNLLGTYQYRDYNKGVRLRGGILEYLNDTYHCMSGSPVWVKRHPSMGGRVMVAVHISGDDIMRAGVANRGVLIAGSVRDLVRAHSFYPPAARLPARPVLRAGSGGTAVRELQYRLNVWIASRPDVGLAPLAVDGAFGPRTGAAVQAFQWEMALRTDAVVGPQTWGRLLRGF